MQEWFLSWWTKSPGQEITNSLQLSRVRNGTVITQPTTRPEIFSLHTSAPTTIKLEASAGTSEGRCCPWLPSSAVLAKVSLLPTSLLISVTGILRWAAEVCLRRPSRLRPLPTVPVMRAHLPAGLSPEEPLDSSLQWKRKPSLVSLHQFQGLSFCFSSSLWKWEALGLSGYSSMPWATRLQVAWGTPCVQSHWELMWRCCFNIGTG